MDKVHSQLALMVGAYIKEARTKDRIVQKNFARDIGLSAQFVGRIEKGEVMIPPPALKKAITVLGLKESKLKKIYRTSAEMKVKEIYNLIRSEEKKDENAA